MFKPLIDIFKYLKIFQVYLGIRMYWIYVLGTIASISEGIGILMLLPLLQSLDSDSDVSKFDGGVNEVLYRFIEFLGFSDSIISILLLISIAFLFKGVITFIALGLTASLLGQLLKEIKVKLFNLYSNMSYGYFSTKNTGDLINLINEQPTKALESFRHLSLLGSHFINTII
ncbi:ABC transporter ATP-binding protein, partial [bacterium]|nr:ABC transporter ATP-binding protein [bacterium]